MPSHQRIGKPHELSAHAVERVLKRRGKKKAQFTFAAQGDRVRRDELFVTITWMTHDEMAPARRAEITGEIGGIIASRIERRKAGETVVCGETSRGRLLCKASREPGNSQRLRKFDATPQNGQGAIRARAQPELAGQSSLFEASEQKGADLRKNLDMLMAVDEGGSGAEMIAKAIELARNFLRDLGARKRLFPRRLDQLANVRKASGRREKGHVSKRAAEGEIEVEANVGLGLKRAQLTRALWP